LTQAENNKRPFLGDFKGLQAVSLEVANTFNLKTFGPVKEYIPEKYASIKM